MRALRYNPAIYAAHEVYKKNIIGEPLLITAQKSYKLGTRPDFYKKRKTYGGTILWVGIHAIDWVYWFTEGGIRDIDAGHTRKFNNNHGELESAALIFYRLKNGGLAGINIDYLRPDKASTHGDDRIRIAGEKGIIEVMNNKALLITSNEETEIALQPEKNIFSEFVNQILNKDKCLVSAEDTFRVTELAIKSQNAADKNIFS